MSDGFATDKEQCSACGKWTLDLLEHMRFCVAKDITESRRAAYTCHHCGKEVGICEVHSEAICTRYKLGARMASYQADVFNGVQKKEITMSDEQLARKFYDYVSQNGIPRMPEGTYGSGEKGQFDDLTIKQIREMAAFVRAMRFDASNQFNRLGDTGASRYFSLWK